MGEVEKVWDQMLGRPVALKRIRSDLAREPLIQRFFTNEPRIVARLDHPGIIPIYDSGRDADERLFFTMKFIPGRKLGEVLPSWSLRRRIESLLWVCEALASAHQVGVIHRDLKPDNIMVGAHGEAYVMDWGLAQAQGEEPAWADLAKAEVRAGQVVGTPGYMAPEQAGGDNTSLSPASDVYALGAILYLTLTDRPAFTGERAEILATMRRGPPTPPGLTIEGEDLWRIIQDTVRQDPADRPPHAGALAEQLRRWLEGDQRRARADQWLDQARALLPEIHEKRSQSAALLQGAAAQRERVQSWDPIESKRALWELEEQRAALERGALQADILYAQALQAALSHDPDNAAAHAGLADHYRARHAAAEQARDETSAAHLEAALRQHDRAGRHTAYLSGEGSLNLRTDPLGARVLLHRYEEVDRRLEPRLVQDLGPTPLIDVPLPMGSYLLVIQAPDRADVRYPVCIGRQERWDGIAPGEQEPRAIYLPRRGELGQEEVYVPAGWYQSGGDTLAYSCLPAQRRWLEGFAIGRFPVTQGQYRDFLNDLLEAGREADALRFVPRERPASADKPGQMVYGRDASGRFALPTADAEADLWDLRWPAMMIDWRGAQAYADWLCARAGLPWRLPSELEWEKAAGGVDGRIYPWGNRFDATWACVKESHPHRPLPARVDDYPGDEGPYGVRGMAGNVREFCQERFHPHRALVGEPIDLGDPRIPRVLRGGGWLFTQTTARIGTRYEMGQHNRADTLGFRLARSLP